MNEYEIERIAASVNCLRPDWPVKSLVTLMKRPELARKPRRDMCVAFAWIACESGTANPGRVIEAGPWWRAAAVEEPHAGRPVAPRREDQCADCGRPLTECSTALGCGTKAQRRTPSGPSDLYRTARAAMGEM